MRPRARLLAGAVLVLAGCTLLMALMPVAIRTGCWTHAILRNWSEYGWTTLAGRAVHNPGGIGVLSAPAVYSGHSPLGLYPVHALRVLTGGRLDETAASAVLLGLVTAAAAWALLRGSPWAAPAAFAAAFSAGSLRMASFHDPILLPMVLGLPLLARCLSVLRREHVTGTAWAGLLALLLPVLAINWTSAFLLAVLLAHLLVALPERRGRWLALALAGGGAVVAVTLLATQDKGGSVALPGQAFNSYLFGPRGYDGRGMDWARAVVRVGAACALSLLPLALVLTAAVWRRPPREVLPALLPLAAAIAPLAFMRNYFAHHPWMATPVVLAGLLATLSLLGLRRRPGGWEREPSSSLVARAAVTAPLILAWNAGVILFFQANLAGQSSLMRLVSAHTERRDILVVSPATDPWLADNRKVLSELFDRHLVLDGEALPAEAGRAYRLTARPPDGGAVRAWQESPEPGSARLRDRMVDWYRKHVARRPKGDRLEVEGPYALLPLSASG